MNHLEALCSLSYCDQLNEARECKQQRTEVSLNLHELGENPSFQARLGAVDVKVFSAQMIQVQLSKHCDLKGWRLNSR